MLGTHDSNYSKVELPHHDQGDHLFLNKLFLKKFSDANHSTARNCSGLGTLF